MERSNILSDWPPFDFVPDRLASGTLLGYGLLCAILLNFVWAGGHDEQRILELVFLFAAAGLLVQRPLTGSVLARPGPAIVWPLAGFFALGILSSARAISPRFASYETSSLFLLLLVALAVARDLARDRGSITVLLKMFAAIACAYAFKIVTVYIAVWLVDARPETIDFTPGFTNIRHLNHVQTIGLPLLALVLVLTPERSGLRRLWMGGAVIWWTILFATGGRGSLLAIGAGSVLAIALRGRTAWPLLRTLASAALLGALVYVVFFWMLPKAMGLPPFGEAASVLGRTLRDPINGRRLLWACALELIQQHPWLGVGPLHFVHYGMFRGDAAHPHNWMLQIGSEWGLPALALLCIALAFAARGLLRAGAQVKPEDTINQHMLAAWILIGAAVLVEGMVAGNIVMPQSQMMIVLYIACAVGWTWSFMTVPDEPGSKLFSNGVRLVALVAALALANAVTPEIFDKAINGTSSATAAAGHYGYWWTRLWLDTHF